VTAASHETDQLGELAKLVREKNKADLAIAELIGRPCLPGNIGEYIAARVFGIQLMDSGAHPGHDGFFQEGDLAGKTVNIKTYSRQEYVLDISPHPCDYYLVLAGPPGQARVRPSVIGAVYLLERHGLLAKLRERGVKIGIATSIQKAVWDSARIFPPALCAPYRLTDRQCHLLSQFCA
jgi:hypothetical protein